jgi:hypothetical protein
MAMRCVSARSGYEPVDHPDKRRGDLSGWTLVYGLVGLSALACTPQVFAQGRVGGGGGGANSFGSGSSMGGGSFGSGGSFGGGGGGGGGSFGGGASGSGGSFLNSSSGSSGSFSGGGTGIIGTTSSISAVGNSSSQGGAFGGQTRAGATGTGGVSSSNPFASYYADPKAAGLSLSGVSRRSTFGNPLFANVNPTTTSSGLGSTGLSGNMGLVGSGAGFPGLGSTGGYGSGAYGGTGTSGVRVPPKYSAALNFSPNTTASSGLQANLQRMVSQSAALQSSRAIQVALDGSTVVLRGWAADDHDRRLAEGMVRLTPGVRDVRNELQVATAAAPKVPAATGQASTRP